MFNAEPIDIKKDLAEIKQAIKKEIALFRQMQKQRPMVAIGFKVLSIIMLAVAVCFLLYLFDKTGHLVVFLSWWQKTTISEKLIDSLIYIGRLVLGLVLIYFLVIKPPKGFIRWSIYLPFMPRFSEKTEQAIIQAPAKVFDCVYYLVKKWLFNNKK